MFCFLLAHPPPPTSYRYTHEPSHPTSRSPYPMQVYRAGTDVQDLFNIQPKRANWDLKRDMTNRMSKLDRKTNEAIATLFRESWRPVLVFAVSARLNTI